MLIVISVRATGGMCIHRQTGEEALCTIKKG
jgi:hypothetical protein